MVVTEQTINEALRSVKYPGYSRDIVSFGLVKNITTNQGAVSLQLELSTHNPQIAQTLKAECERALKGQLGVTHTHIDVRMPPAAAGPGPATASGQSPWNNQSRIPGLNRIIAVASGKGGVGKSTVAVNLACALRNMGAEVGLLDCDIYGPSIPLMMGVRQKPTINEQEKMVPPASYGIKLMSMGFLVEGDNPVIWRGPMIMKTVQQFFHSVDWGTLDYLLVDLPPGTGDAQLSLCQTVPLDGGVIVTTPQEASLGVVRKGIAMFEKVNVPILGIIENMSYFTTPTGERVEIFGHGGGQMEAKRQNISFLGEVPLFTDIREGGDKGEPVTVSKPDSAAAKAFYAVAESLQAKLGQRK